MGREDEPPDRSLAEFQSTLRRFKREGCSLLVVGEAPRTAFTRASDKMLGDADVRRFRVFGRTDASRHSVYDRLPTATTAPRPAAETTKVVTHAVSPRPASETGTARAERIPEVTVTESRLDELRAELVAAVEEFGERTYRPAELRVAIDSLAPLLDRYERSAVRRFLGTVGERVRAYDGMVHCILPTGADSAAVWDVASEFDAIVELRTPTADTDHDAEERWHVLETGTTMPWVPV